MTPLHRPAVTTRMLCPEHIFAASHGRAERGAVEQIGRLPGVAPSFLLSPESKEGGATNLTGMMFRTEAAEMRAYPGLVPDNGCGFLLARVGGLGGFDDWEGLAAALRSEGGVFSRARGGRIPDDLLAACMEVPLPDEPDDLPEQCAGFLALLRADRTLAVAMRQPFGCFLGHFLEIREAAAPNGAPDGHILILHAGSQRMHRMLNNILHERYGYHSHTYGAPLNTPEGLERRFAATLALRYARASRLLALDIVSGALRSAAGADAELLSDVFHSFLHYGPDGVVHARGMQALAHPYNILREPLFLLAGTQQTSSYLMRAAGDGILCHGTPERFRSAPKSRPAEPPATLRWRDEIDPNDPSPALLEGVTLEMARHFEAEGVAAVERTLRPVFNMRRADARKA